MMHLICGEALYDVFIDSSETISEVTLRAVAGGSPFNVAVGLARLGIKVALATDLALDPLGHRLALQLAREGVCGKLLSRTAAATALAFVTVGCDGSPSYSFSGLNDSMWAPDIESIRSIEAALTNLHVGSVALVLPQSAERLTALVRHLSESVLVSLDPNVRLSVEPDQRRWRDAIESIRPHAHVIKVSEEDIYSIYGHGVDLHELCGRWLTHRTGLVVLTRGVEGAVLLTRNNDPILVPAAPTSLVDTVGAGDAFMAALLAGLARTGRSAIAALLEPDVHKIEELGRYAAAAASCACAKRGPALPYAGEVDALAASLH